MTETKKPEPESSGKTTEHKDQQQKEQTTDLLEADDLFEEFGNDDSHTARGEEELPLWEADWDDENVADDFTGRLKAELDQRGMKE